MAEHNATRELRLSMLLLAELVTPMHEWLAGQRAYFLGQGYTPDEARAMAAATYVAVFGQSIRGEQGKPKEQE
ncbi:hypothetical protein ACIBTV_26760 [Micromonospora sp. NPDC049366]|uniref:hypothetical protein n=1 Tax=Micromonospora sp. NPDC049366 TaxID=3364271 RepID=UPI0037873617